MFKIIRDLRNHTRLLVGAIGVAMIASAVAMTPSNAAAFKLKQVKGNYAVNFHGDELFTNGTGIFTFDGTGGVSGTITFFAFDIFSIDEDEICVDTVSGTNSLNADGVTGTIALTVNSGLNIDPFSDGTCPSGIILTLATAVDQNARTIEMAESDDYSPGTFDGTNEYEQIIGVARRQSGKKTIKGTYGFQFDGDDNFDTGAGALTVTSGGAVSGTMALNADGCLCVNSLAGTSTTSGDGVTGLMALTVTNVSNSASCSSGAFSCGDATALTLATALDNSGKEVQFAEIDPFDVGGFFSFNTDPIVGVMHRK